MIRSTSSIELFKRRIKILLEQATGIAQTKNFRKNQHIYTSGDKSESVYWIESGKIKISTLSASGKECLHSVYSTGDIFGESGLSESEIYRETAIAVERTVVKRIHNLKFFMLLQREQMFEEFVKYLLKRIDEQQEIITDLVTMDSEKRLGKTLLRLAEKIGKPVQNSIMINHKFSQEELAAMVGTTRPRISEFLQRFLKRNLIETGSNRLILVKEKNLSSYLDSTT